MPDAYAGTEFYTDALANYCKYLGHEVFIIVPDYNRSDECKNYIYNNIQILTYKEPDGSTRDIILGYKKPDGLKNFTDLLSKLKPDIVHFQEITGSAGITIWHLDEAKKIGCKVILTMHLSHYTCQTGVLLQNSRKICDGLIKNRKCSTCSLHHNKNIPLPLSYAISLSQLLLIKNTQNQNFRYFPGIFYYPLINRKKEHLKQIEELCDKIIVITNWYRTILIKNMVSPDKICLVKQGVRLAASTEMKHKFNGTLRIIFIGRIHELKGLDILLKAVKKIDPSKYHIDIYGKNDDKKFLNYCQSLIKNDTLTANFKGIIEGNTVLDVLKNYDILCLPSIFSEMSPLVIQEAFAAGIPVIGTNVYGIAEQIRHNENGLLFNFKDVNNLRNQISLLINQPNLLNTLKKNVQAPRTFDMVGNEMIKIYKNLVN
jgi:Glycosyltransferase